MMKEYIDEAEKALLHTYNRYQVVLEKGDGVYLYDMEEALPGFRVRHRRICPGL